MIEKEGLFQTVQCKVTTTKDNTVYLRSCGGTKGTEYDNVLNHPVDLLFCINNEQKFYVIPVNDIRESGNKKSISLSLNSK